MREMRYGVDTRVRYPSPRRPPSSYREYSPRRRHDGDKYSWKAERSRRIEKRDGFDRDLNLPAGRFCDIVDRDRDRYGVGARRSRSPQRIVRRESPQRIVRRESPQRIVRRESPQRIVRRESPLRIVRRESPLRIVRRESPQRIVRRESPQRIVNWESPQRIVRRESPQRIVRRESPQRIVRRDRVEKDVSVQSARLSYYDVRDRDKCGVGVDSPRRLYNEDLLRRDSTSTKFQLDHPLDGPRKSDGLNVKDYSYKNDYHGVGDTNLTRGGGERDYYPKSQYSDVSRVGLTSVSQNFDGTQPIFLEYEKGRRMYSDTYTLAHGGDGGVTKSYLGAGDGSNHISSVASRYLNTDTDKQGYFHFKNEIQLEKRGAEFCDQEEHNFEKKNEELLFNDGLHLDELGIERPVGREMFKNKKEDNLLSSRGYLKGDSDYLVSSSRSKDRVPMSSSILDDDFPGYSAAGDFHKPSHGIRPGTGLDTEPFGLDGYSEKPQHMSPRGPGGRFDDSKSHSRLYSELPEEKCGDPLYPEFGRSTKLGDHFYPEFGRITKPRDVGEEYGVQHMSRFGPLDSIDEINKSSHLKHMGDDRLWDKYPSSPGRSTSNSFDACRSHHTRKQDLDMLGSGSLHLYYGREAFRGCGGIKPGECNDEVYGGPQSLFERSDVLPTKEFDRSLGRVHGSHIKGLALADLSSVEPSERRFGGQHARDDILDEHGIVIRISSDGSGARKIYNHVDAGDDVDPASFLKEPKLSNHKLEKTRESREMASYEISSSQFITSHSSDPDKSGFRDIKKRLGPAPQKLHVLQRLVKKSKPSIKKRLACVPSNKHATLPWLKKMSSNKLPSIQDNSDGSPLDQDRYHLGDYLTLAKPEPPEKSEDFKQLVYTAFFKFLKQLNETPKKRKKYTEQGKAGSLNCIVCGSNSNEFSDTESLAMHAFTSDKAGLRSQHLGLYKALCVLMGWKSAEEPNTDWHCEVMSNAETSALKEDLIIWPPVMIVHNCSIDNKKSDERVIVSTETLDAKLRGMGFGSILKVSNGKPANQSVMVVRFNGTLSGLQEAERLHQSYVENKHGREHLKQLKSSKNGSSSEGTQVLPADKEEKSLYGYLGIADDLDKLDFETKKRCVMRSKKEILSIVNACV